MRGVSTFPITPCPVPLICSFFYDFPSTLTFKKVGNAHWGGLVIFKLGQYSVLFDCPDFYESLHVFCFCCSLLGFFFPILHGSNAWQPLLPLC